MLLYEKCSQKSTRKTPPKHLHLWRIRGTAFTDKGPHDETVHAVTSNRWDFPDARAAFLDMLGRADVWHHHVKAVSYVGAVSAADVRDEGVNRG